MFDLQFLSQQGSMSYHSGRSDLEIHLTCCSDLKQPSNKQQSKSGRGLVRNMQTDRPAEEKELTDR